MSRPGSANLRATVDEIERNSEGELVATLVSDSGAIMTVPVALLPDGVRVSDVVRVSFQVDQEETERRHQRISNLQNQLFDRS